MKYLVCIIITCLRYPAAIIIAYVASALTAFCSFILGVPFLRESLLSLACFQLPIGFVGVFSGALCFPRSNRPFCNRAFGSLVLLALGLCYEILEGAPHGKPVSIRAVVATGIGGLIAAASHYRHLPPNHSLEPTTAASSVSDVAGNPNTDGESKSASGDGGSTFGR
jgi:hypothetical protein